VKLIQETIDTREIDQRFPRIEVDENYIRLLKKSAPKTIGGAIDLVTTVIVETKKHPTSPFFINLRRDVEKTYEELRARKTETREVLEKLLNFSQKIMEWKREEKEIGKDKYPIYEAIKLVLPNVNKEHAIETINLLTERLQEKGFLFKGWQQQRDIRRKVRAEIMLLLLSKFKDEKDKIGDLLDGTFEALEEIR